MKLKVDDDASASKKICLVSSGEKALEVGEDVFLRFFDTSLERIRNSIQQLKPSSFPLLSLLDGTTVFASEYAFDDRIEIPESLNTQQKIAFHASMSNSNKIVLIRGPPGTGKTQIISNIAGTCLNNPNFRVLICSQSNETVDHIVSKIHLGDDKLIRFQSLTHETNFPNTPFSAKAAVLKILGDHARQIEIDDQKMKLLNEAQVVCSTIGALDCQKMFGLKQFDMLILDEASMAGELEVLQAIAFFPKRVILIGDDRQLGPHCDRNSHETSSLFTRLLKAGYPVVELLDQYRMKSANCALISQLFYENKLRTAGKDVEGPWEQTLFFVNSDGKEHKELDNQGLEETSYYNAGQVEKIFGIIDGLVKKGLEDLTKISIITPYVSQKKRIDRELKARLLDKDVKAHIIDAFQGKENDIIIFSTVRSKELGFIRDPQRLNVALSRARESLYVIGCKKLLSEPIHGSVWNQVLEIIEQYSHPNINKEKESPNVVYEDQRENSNVEPASLPKKAKPFIIIRGENKSKLDAELAAKSKKPRFKIAPESSIFPREAQIRYETESKQRQEKCSNNNGKVKRHDLRSHRFIIQCQHLWVPDPYEQGVTPEEIEKFFDLIPARDGVEIQGIEARDGVTLRSIVGGYRYLKGEICCSFSLWIETTARVTAEWIRGFNEKKDLIIGCTAWKLPTGYNSISYLPDQTESHPYKKLKK